MESKKTIYKEILEWIYCIIIAVVLALLVRYFIGTPTIVQQKSMYPTLKPNQRLILNRWSRTIKSTPQRGEIITFEAPTVKTLSSRIKDTNSNPTAIYEKEPTNIFSKFTYYVLEIGKESYIKRVIALPGEYVEIKQGAVYINGEKLEEEYLTKGIVTDMYAGSPTENYYTNFTVPENCVYALGDNRTGSTDSRAFGCIPLEKIESKVLFRFWPLSKFGGV